MPRVSIVFHTVHGHTRTIAERVAVGARSVDEVDVELIELTTNQIVDSQWWDQSVVNSLQESDAIIFGAPTLMGSISSVFKSFIEAAFPVWDVQGWKDKLAGGFTNSASQSGDKLLSLQQLAIFAAQMNMLWIPVGDLPGNNWSGSRDDINRLGSWLGLMSQSNADQGGELAGSYGDWVTAERYGARVAHLAGHWAHGWPYTTERLSEADFRKLSARTAADAPDRL